MKNRFLKAIPGWIGLAICITACGGESADVVVRDETSSLQEDSTDGEESSGGMRREGPAGCYLPAEMRCDCEVSEEGCGSELSGTWVDEGCASCAE